MNFLFAISLIVKILPIRMLRYPNMLCNFATREMFFFLSFFLHLKRVYRVWRKL